MIAERRRLFFSFLQMIAHLRISRLGSMRRLREGTAVNSSSPSWLLHWPAQDSGAVTGGWMKDHPGSASQLAHNQNLFVLQELF